MYAIPSYQGDTCIMALYYGGHYIEGILHTHTVTVVHIPAGGCPRMPPPKLSVSWTGKTLWSA